MMLDHILFLAKILLLLGVANGTPIVAKKVLGDRWNTPLDGGLCWFDGRPLLGESKTVRGIVLSIAFTALAATGIGIDAVLGAGIASTAMLGDLLSSFIKRRMKQPPHAQATGLDQIPESLLPLVILQRALGIGVVDIIILVTLFIVLEIVLSRLLFHLQIRDRPY